MTCTKTTSPQGWLIRLDSNNRYPIRIKGPLGPFFVKYPAKMITTYKTNYLQQSGHGSNFNISLGELPKTFDNYYVESCRAAEYIYANKTGRLHLLYSGGVDSEYALNIFHHLGMEVVPVIIKLNSGYNDHDTEYAFQFCESKGLTPKVVDIDFDHFVRSGQFIDLIKKLKTSKYQYTLTAHVSCMLDGTVLNGDGEAFIRKRENSNQWDIVVYEFDYSVVNYMESQGIPGTAHFNCYTPEMFLSFLADRRIEQLAGNKVPGKLTSTSSKFIVYNRHSNFNLVERPKYHGYEKIEQSEIFKHEAFREAEKLAELYNGEWTAEYFDFMERFDQ